MSEDNPKQSILVVMPAFNAECYLAEALDSVLRQTVKNWELMIVNDGSTDKTKEIAQVYVQRDRRIHLLSQSNAGPGAARNLAIQQSNPEIPSVAFLDADDVWDSNALQTLSVLLEAHPTLVAAHGHERAVDSDGRSTSGYREVSVTPRRAFFGNRVGDLSPEEPTTFSALVLENCIPCNAMLVRRSALYRAGLFGTNRRIIEDWDLWLRLSLLSDIAHTDQVVYSYREHSGGLSKDIGQIAIRELSTRRRTLTITCTDRQKQRIVRMALRYQERGQW